MFGAGVTGEGAFSVYEGRDIELDPAAPVTAVLSVAFIPPEEMSEGGAPKPCVSCFLVDDLPQNRRKGSRASVDGVPAVFMECTSAKPEKVFVPGASAAVASSTSGAGEDGPSLKGPPQPQQPLRKSTRASTVAHSKAASKRARHEELSAPSTNVPLEDADTVFLVGDHPVTLARTASWLQKSLGMEAVIIGDISSCALVVGDQVRSRVVGHAPQAYLGRNHCLGFLGDVWIRYDTSIRCLFQPVSTSCHVPVPTGVTSRQSTPDTTTRPSGTAGRGRCSARSARASYFGQRL